MKKRTSPRPSQSNWTELRKLEGWKERLEGLDVAGVVLDIEVQTLSIEAGEVIYREGDPPDYFYIVGEGEVIERVRRQGQVWFERRLGPGQFFGQQGLYSQAYASHTRAEEPGYLFRLNAAGLREILDRNPQFLDELLPEARARRLRGIPLFRSLDDGEIRWLAQVTDEQLLKAGQPVPMQPRGLWIIDYGRVRVEGPAAGSQERWYLTAGNFFLTPEVLDDSDCVATAAQSDRFATHLYFLAADHVELLAETVADVARIIRQPVDLAGELVKVELFGPDALLPAQRRQLAQYCAWEFVPAGQNITTQGKPGHSFVILRHGAAVVHSVDREGRPRPRSYLEAPAAFGRTSLLEGRQRNATVRAVSSTGGKDAPALDGAEIVDLDRRDLVHAFVEGGSLWNDNVPLYHDFIVTEPAVTNREYPWMKADEVLDWHGRRHPLWLWVRLFAVVAVGAVISLIFLLLAGRNAWLEVGELWLLLLIPGIIFILDYFDDYYAVTNRRVTRRDRFLMFYRQRVEAPINQIEDVTVRQELVGSLFGYGTVDIRTAATAPPIAFTNVPKPEQVRATINREKEVLTAAEVAQRRERLRQGLMAGLNLGLLTPERTPALGPEAPPPGESARGCLSSLRRQSPGEAESASASKDEIVWRKHWLNAVQRTWKPGVLFLLSLIILAAGLLAGALQGENAFIVIAALMALLVSIPWLGWEYADYRNDQYILTREMIIDIEKKPLGFSTSRRTATLDRIETVNTVQRSIWANLLNYGDIVIRTAAADQQGLDFLFIGNPRTVQSIIYRRVGEARTRREQRELRLRQQELSETLDVYHELTAEDGGRRPSLRTPRRRNI